MVVPSVRKPALNIKVVLKSGLLCKEECCMISVAIRQTGTYSCFISQSSTITNKRKSLIFTQIATAIHYNTMHNMYLQTQATHLFSRT